MIQLEDFVAETLKQIISGIRTAQTYAVTNGASINPPDLFFRTDQGSDRLWARLNDQIQIAQDIKFDVAVTTMEGTKTKGGIGVFVGPIGVGSHGQSDATNRSVSRIMFSVPLLLPLQPKT